MDTVIRAAAVILGALGIFYYFHSIVRVMLINRREDDFVERFARSTAVSFIHWLIGDDRDYAHTQRLQAWVLPIFLFVAVVTWFLLVQLSFSFILWGLRQEPGWPANFSSSGSALSTLGYKTPPQMLGQYLAIFEAGIGLAVVILLFTFVPGYQTAVQVRERKVGWLYARTGSRPTTSSLLQALHRSGQLKDPNSVWEMWEHWFRGVFETHSIVPVLSYVPSIYRGASWLGASAAVLDSASLLIACLDEKDTESARICRMIGTLCLKSIAEDLNPKETRDAMAGHNVDPNVIASFDSLYDELIDMGLPVLSDKDACRARFLSFRGEFEPSVRVIAKSTLMPVEEPWILPHPRSNISDKTVSAV